MPIEVLSKKMIRTHHSARYNIGGHYAIWCDCCKDTHEFAVDRPFHNGARWSFDGNVDNPTFAPSMNIRIGPYPDASKRAGQIDVCHFFVQNGKIVYCDDCTHALSGHTVDLPDIPEEYLGRSRNYSE